MNTASTSGSRTLPDNTIANPKSKLKAITTRSGLVTEGPTVPNPPKSVNPEEDECVEETYTDPDHAEYTIKVPPPPPPRWENDPGKLLAASDSLIRSSSRLTRDQTSNPTSSTNTTPKVRNRRSSTQKVENSNLEEHLHPVVTIADNRTMAEMLRAPTEGYAEAIVVPPILAEKFELKHSLINMMTTDQFFGLEMENPHDHIRAARRWLEKEPPRSITMWEDPVSKFINEFFPPSRTTNQDYLNAAASGNLLEKSTQYVLTIIENKSKVCNSQSNPIASQVKACDTNSNSEIAKLTHAVNQQTSAMTTAMTAMLKQFQATPPPAPIKAVEEICVTCGGAHPYHQCLAAGGNTFPEFKDNIQGYLLAAAVNYNQGNPGYRPQGVANQMRPPVMQTQIDMVKNELRNEMKTSIQTSLSYQTNEIKNMMASLLQMNTASTSGSRSLMSNTIANPKGDLKAITTRSGLVTDGPTVPTPLKSITPEVDERVEETYTDPDLAEYTIKVPPLPVQKYKPPSQREFVVHKRDPLHSNIPYPSRMLKQKQQEKDEVQIQNFWQMFKQLHINIALAYVLVLMPKYQKMLKALLSNKEKLQELANTPLNEKCSAVILKKLPEKLGDPGKFLIPYGFCELKCKALADLGASINLMPMSVWKELGLPELIPTRMTLKLVNRAICTPAGIARDVFVLVGKFTFPADFAIVDYEIDPRVPLILGRPFLRTARALIDVHGEEMILRDDDERLTLNMRQDTSSYSNQTQRESVNLINIFNVSSEDFLEFDIESDLKEIEFLLYHDKDSSLKDSIDQKDLANLEDNFVDPIPEMFTDEHAPNYSSLPIFDVYDDDFLEVESNAENVYDDPFDSKGEKITEAKLLIDELDLPCDFLPPFEYDSFISKDFSRVDALPSTNNEDKDKKLAISNAFLVLEDFDPSFYEPFFFKDVPKSKMLLLFSSKNEEKVFKPGIYTSEKPRWENDPRKLFVALDSLIRSSSRLTRDQTSNPTSSTNTSPKGRNRRSSTQKVENSNLEEHLHPLVTMTDNRTMAEMLRAPTEGYTEAIVVPLILAEQFELKHSLINMMTIDQFFGLEMENPHDHISCLPNEISNFQQKFEESFHEALDRYKDLLRACPHYDFTELHQLNTFYNALNPADQDSLNAAAGGNLLEKTPVKDVEKICVTCGCAHPYYQCRATGGNTFPEFRDNIQGYVLAVAVNYNQGNPGYRPQGVANQMRPAVIAQQNQNFHLKELEKIKRMNEINMKCMQSQIDMVKNELRNEIKPFIQTSLSNQTNEIKNMMASLLQMNTASTLGSGSLPSNIVANQKGELKANTTRSGLVTDGPTVPTPPKTITLEVDERVEENYTDLNLTEYTIKGKLKAITTRNGLVTDGPTIPTPPKSITPKVDEGVEETYTYPDLVDELKCKALADLGASINLMPLSVWKELGLPELIPTRMTLELANRAICTPAGIARDVFVPVGKFTFPADFVIVDYESDPRVPLILGRPFLRTARALIDVHGEEMILCDDDERLTLNMRHDTSSYSNQPQRESVNLINIFNVSSEDFLEVSLLNQPSGDPTFSPHQELTSSEVTNDIFDSEGSNVLFEKLLDLHSTNDIHPPLDDNPLSGSTTYFSNSLLEEFTDELALITYPLDYDDNLQFDIESDLKEIEFLLYHDKDSSLKDSIDQKDLANLEDNFVDPIPEMFTDEHAPDYSSPPIFDVYDDVSWKLSPMLKMFMMILNSKGEKITESKLLINELDLPCDFLPPSEYDSLIF
nr:reverse transcriptase domain-containing protein [Tanacetum cinerariifolium]